MFPGRWSMRIVKTIYNMMKILYSYYVIKNRETVQTPAGGLMSAGSGDDYKD